MDVRLSPEQQALRDAASAMVDRFAPGAVANLRDPERTSKLDAAMEGAGWRELRIAEDGGGPLASGVEAAIVAEELGRGPADIAFLGPTLAVELRRLAGAAPAEERQTVALSQDLSALAGTAPGGVVAVDADDCRSALGARPSGGVWELVEGPAVGHRQAVDITRSVADFDLASATAVGTMTEDQLQAWAALALSLGCADLVGIMRGAIDLAAQYAASRRQYGVPIGSFQAVQHLLADAFVAMEGSRSVARHAAWAVDALDPSSALTAASVAKAYCARAARTVCETAIQVHGGIGNTWECLAHVYLRRSVLSGDVLGGAGPSLRRVLEAKGIGGGNGLR